MKLTLRRAAPALVAALTLTSAAALATPPPAAADRSESARRATFTDLVRVLPGLTHYYPLTRPYGGRDLAGAAPGRNHGAVFTRRGAVFDGDSYVELPDRDNFSVTDTGTLQIVAFLTVDDWSDGGEAFVHWMGKGEPDAHEWAFRMYGEDGDRPHRLSFYQFNSQGGWGVGSYFQDPVADSREIMVVARADRSSTRIWRGATQRDLDLFDALDVVPRNGDSPVRLGTRDLASGFLQGSLRRVAFFDRALSVGQLTRMWAARRLPD